MPDFDIDFCMEGRDRVIDYVARALRPRARLADHHVRHHGREGGGARRGARARPPLRLRRPHRQADSVRARHHARRGARQGGGAAQALQGRGRGARGSSTWRSSLEGLARNAGTHAGGVVIAPSVLTDFAPLYCEAGGGSVVTQFDKDDVEAAGLVKFDFLGLRTLTIIDWAVRTINARARGARRAAARHRRRCPWTTRRPTSC